MAVSSTSYRSGNKNPSFSHGMYGTPVYRSWMKMKERCFNKRNVRYEKYGGRGITVCDKWLSFSGFFEDMGERPRGYSIDRIDNTKGYYKENCRWSSPVQQSRNRRSNVIYELDGYRMCMKDWAAFIGVSQSTLKDRLKKYNWSLRQALSTPNLGTGKKRVSLAFR